ncbi:MAG: hypothetical protein M1339_07120, partial [Bacteroidetes bacterium]|nr:hypothetical protein [Bacteroidota bacterium]
SKKMELEEKFGAKFGKGEGEVPPEIESQWLSNIEQFELQFKNAKRVTVREYVGNPDFKPFDRVPREQLAEELGKVLDYLESHGVGVDFICDVADDVAYKFVLDEIMDHEIDDMHLPGWMTRFIYEEFHPNDEYDAKEFASQFLWHLFEREVDFAVGDFAKDEVYDRNGNRTSRTQMRESIVAFHAKYAAFTSHKFECSECTLEGEYANVSFTGMWTGLRA